MAFDSGYSDQAYLICECRFFTWFSPEVYLRHRFPLEEMIFKPFTSMSRLFNTRNQDWVKMPPESFK